MKNYVRAVRLALRYRWTLAGALLSSLAVALFWGANIGVVYPVVEVVFKDQSLHEWIDTEIASSEQRTGDLRQSLAQLRGKLPTATADDAAQIKQKISYQEMRLTSEEGSLAGRRFLLPYIHRFAPHGAFQTLALVVLALLIGTILKDVFLVCNTYLVGRLAQLATFDLRKQFYRRTLRMDLPAFGQDKSGELMSRFTIDMEALNSGLIHLFGRAVREPMKMAACLIGAALISWRLLLLSLILVPLSVFILRRLAQSIKRANRRAMAEMSQLYSLLSETFSGIEAVKAFTMEPLERGRFHRSAKQYYRKAMRIVFYNALSKPFTELFGIGVISLALLAGAYLVLGRHTHLLGIKICDPPLMPALLILFYALLAGTSDPARKLADIVNLIQRSAAAADRIYDMLDRQPAIADPAAAQHVPRPHRELVFDHVHFAYTPGQPVLQDISLRIAHGETLAIVGPNGCGKTTLAKLIARFLDPAEGSVCLDQVDLRQMRVRDLRGRIGIVTQKTLLFNDTVLNNIRYGSLAATQDQVIQAAKQAHADHFIQQKLEAGYDTVIGQSGSRLSGGQQQRIALARAILRDPDILILDEATSQIDLQSEQLIHQALEQFIRDRTTIIITHRLSTLALADRILVMQAGRVADIGTHDQLFARCELYKRLCEIQLKQSA